MKKMTLALSVSLALGSPLVNANPTGAQVVQGTASFATPSANVLNVTNSHNAIINWQRFNIGPGQTTNFIQPSAASSVLNRVISNQPSQILGNLNSNGRVFLINQNGILVGQGAHINTNGFFASTLNITDSDFLNGKLKFADGGLGDINNQGYIHAGEDGNIVLVAPNIENGGVIEVDNGNIILAAGKSITITSLENSAIEFEVSSPDNSVTNLGQIIANRGAASLFAGSLRHSGLVRANGLVRDADGSIRLVATARNEISGEVDVSGETGGRIEILGDIVDVQEGASVDASGANGGGEILIGGDQQGLNPDVMNATSTTVAENATVNADATDSGDGGRVIVFAENDVHVHGEVTARGGANGGNGGFIETSGLRVLDITNTPDASAENGAAGSWLIDPFDITIQAAGTGSVDTNITVTNLGGSTIRTSNADSAILTTDTIVNALDSGISVIVQTGAGGTQQGNITINDPINAGPSVSLVSLTLNAHNDINVNADITNVGFGYDLILNANSDTTGGGQINFSTATLNVGGSVTLDGPAFINGVTNFSGGNVILTDVLTVNAGGQFLKGFGQFSGAGSFVNDGTSIFSGNCGDGCTSVDMDVPFTNNNVLRLDEVFFNVNNTMTNSGLIDLVPTIFQDGPGLKIGNGLLAGSLILNPGSGFAGGQGTDITVGPLGVLNVQTPTVLDPDTSLTLFNGTIDNFHNLTILDQAQVFIDGGTLSGPGTFTVDLIADPVITVSGTNPLTINDLVLQLGGTDLLWQAFGPNGNIILNNSSLIVEDRLEITNTSAGAAITGTGSDIVISPDSFLTQFSNVNTAINVPISSMRGYVQLFGAGGGLSLPGDLTVRDGGHVSGIGTLSLGSVIPGTLILESGGGLYAGPETGFGTLSVTGNVQFNADSRAVFGINTNQTIGSDQLFVTGNVNINGGTLYVVWDNFATQFVLAGPPPVDLIVSQSALSGGFSRSFDPVSLTGNVGTVGSILNYQVNTENTASVVFWDGGGDGFSWSDPLNWSGNAVPGTNDSIVIEAGTQATPILLTSLEPGTGSLGDIQIDGFFAIGAGGNLNLGGNLFTRADMEIRDGGTISGAGTWHNLGFTDINAVNTTLTVANIENHAALVWAQLGTGDSVLNLTGNLSNFGSQFMFAPLANSATVDFSGPTGLTNAGWLAIDSGPGLDLNGTFSNLATAELLIAGGDVRVTADNALDGLLSIDPGSSLVFQGGTHSFATTLASAGQMVFDGGTFSGQYDLAAADTLDVSAAIADVTFDGFTVNALGAVLFSSAGNDLLLNNSSLLNIDNSLTLQHSSNTADFVGDGTSAVNNSISATIDMQSASDFNLSAILNSDGNLAINNGSFIVQGATNLSGGNLGIASGAQFRVDNGGVVSLGSTFGSVLGNGQLFVENGGIFDFDVASAVSKDLSTLAALNVLGGSVQNIQDALLPANVFIDGTGVFDGVGTLTIPAGTTVTAGDFTFTGADPVNQLVIDNLGSIDVLAGQTLRLDFADLQNSATGAITGAGSLLIPLNSALTASNSVAVASLTLNGGTINANGMTYSGNLSWLAGQVVGTGLGLTTTGPVAVTDGTLFSDWNLSGASAVQVSGTLDLQGGIIDIAPGASFSIATGGSALVGSTFGGFTGTGPLTVDASGLLDITGSLLDLSGLQTLNVNSGVVAGLPGLTAPSVINVSGSAALTSDVTGTFTIPATTTVNWGGGIFAGQDAQNLLTIDNLGVIDVASAQSLILTFANLTGSGNLTGPGSVVVPTDTILAPSAMDIAQVNLFGGTLTANGLSYNGQLNWQFGTVNGAGLTTSGQVNLLDGNLETDWTIAPTGTVVWGGINTNALIINNATITNQGTFTIQSSIDLVSQTRDAGIAAKDFSLSTNAVFINQGALIIDADIGPTGTTADTVVFDLNFDNQGGTIGIASGNFSLGGQDLLLDQAGESLQGFGTFIGNVVNSAGTVSPGRSDPQASVFQTGALSIAGDYTQGPNGVLIMKLDSTINGLQHDTLNVSGQLSAGGTVDFALVNNSSVIEVAALLDQSFRPFNVGGSFTGSFDSVVIPTGLDFTLGAGGLITISSNNTTLNDIANQLEVLFDNDDLSFTDVVIAMRFVDSAVERALLDDEDEDEKRRAPRLVCK